MVSNPINELVNIHMLGMSTCVKYHEHFFHHSIILAQILQ